jgi:hypothetical protein
MTLWMLLFYMLLGVLLAWPSGLLLRRALRARQSLVCVRPYRPRLPRAEVSDSSTPTAARQKNK